MTTTITNLYRRFRESSPFMLVGHNAQQAFEAAKTLNVWNAYEDAGLVRVRATPDDYPDLSWADDADFATIERLGVWIVRTEYFHAGQWHWADSIGGCIYENPTDPFENCYLIEMMDEAIRQLREA